MVFCGKPSGGCHSCRAKKTRCDQQPEGCGQCKRAKRPCPGYRLLGDVIFRNESDNVIKKFKAKEARAKSVSKSPASIPSTLGKTSDRASEAPSEESLEVVRQYPAPMFAYELARPIEDRATLFFVVNYVIGDRGPTRGHLDYLSDLYQAESLPDGLMASMRAVGLAGYAHAVHAPSLMKNARYQYMKALQFTNAALRSPQDVKKDTTLMAVMILGIYETVTGSNYRSLRAWYEHIAGASALLELRGREQFRTPGGRRMFIQVATSLMISCIQRGLPLPGFIVEWTAEAKKLLSGPVDAAWIVQEMMMEFTNFQASIVNGSCQDPEVILARCLEFDGRYQQIFNEVPPGWEYQTIDIDTDSDFVYNRRYHIYFDFWIAQMWNGMRTVRVILHEHIRRILLNGFSSKPILFNKPEHTAQFQKTTDILYEMQAEILYSVPQHLGVFPRPPPTPTCNVAVPGSEELAVTMLPWSNFNEHNDEEFPVVRASGPYFLLWPLWFAAIMDVATEPIRQFAAQNLNFIGETMGIQQAFFLAKAIETGSEIQFNAKA